MPVLLVAVDFSPRSDRVLRRASLIARSGGYDLFLVHVVESDQAQQQVDMQLAKAEALLAEMGASVRDADGLRCDCRVRVGTRDEAVIMLAQEIGAEMILLGPHRQRPLRDQFVGTLAEKIARSSPAPVLVANGLPTAAYNLVMLPTDLHLASRQASKVATNLRFLRQSQFLFLHMYETVGSEMAARAMASGSDDDEHEREEAAKARAELERFISSCGIDTVHRAEVRAMEGLLVHDLTEAAEQHAADLIAVATSNKGVLERIALGSVTSGLLRSCERDVLVIPR